MEINNFEFSSRRIVGNTFETILTDKESKNKFGCNYNSNQAAPDHVVFEEFKKNSRNFFIDVKSEIVKDEIIVEVKPEITWHIKV